MFFDGFPDKGLCPRGGGHGAAGLFFVLPHDVGETPNAQAAWRFCHKCDVMFFDGSPTKGVCPRGGGHGAAGFTFVLPHDVRETSDAQAGWRFCHKCHVMFFDGFPDKGVCPGGGGHEAAGFTFVLPHLPSRLQFRLRHFAEHKATDNLLQGVNDEVFLSAIGTDSAGVVVGQGGKPEAETIRTHVIGDVSDDRVRGPWRQAPHVLMDFDLRRPSDWPRSFVVTLLIVEEDNQKIAETFDQLEAKVGKEVRDAAVAAATSAAGATVGAAIGSVIPGIGTAVGAGVGALAGFAYDGIINEVKAGLGNEVFTPRPVEIQFSAPGQVRQHPEVNKPQTLEVRQFGAHYAIVYDWFLVE